MNVIQELDLKYRAYAAAGNDLFAVTLSTFVTSDRIARSDRMRHVWDHHFIYRVNNCLTYKNKNRFDHDFVVELSPQGHYHFHGLLAFPAGLGSRIWVDGGLRKQLRSDLDSFERKGENRPFCVNKYLIEPIRSDMYVGAWTRYITKTFNSTTTDMRNT